MDLSQFDKTKTIEDYRNAYDAQRQSLAASSLDQLSKQNIYATQVLSGAAATGNQGAYDAARQHLSDNGIDVSTWAPDVQTGAQQVTAARNAQYTQNPLFPALKAATAMDSNTNTANAANGVSTVNPNAISSQVLNSGRLPNALSAQIPVQSIRQTPQWQNPDAAPINPQVTTGNLQPLPNNNVQAPGVQPNIASQIAPQSIQGGFIAPANDPTKNFAWNKDNFDKAFQQYKESFAGSRQKEAGTAQGKVDIANIEASNKAQELTDRLTKNLQGMLELNDSVPQSGFVPSGAKAYFSRALQANPALSSIGLDTSGDAAKSYAQWNQINNQQVLSEIQQFVASGGANTRVNQTLEKIAKMASSISPEESPATRKAEIQNALDELANKNISGKNLIRDNQGQAPQPYTNIRVTTPSKAEDIVNNTGINTAPPKKGESRNGYLFVGGNPNDKNNWKLK